MKILFTILGSLILIGLFLFVKMLSNVGKRSFEIKDGKVYYCTPIDGLPMFSNWKEIEGADAKSFQRLAFPYARDHQRVYRYAKPIKGCDPKSFEVIGSSKNYAKDKDQVFYGHTPISRDPDHFELISPGLAKDRQRVYRFEEPIKGADPATFEQLDQSYAKDQ